MTMINSGLKGLTAEILQLHRSNMINEMGYCKYFYYITFLYAKIYNILVLKISHLRYVGEITFFITLMVIGGDSCKLVSLVSLVGWRGVRGFREASFSQI